MASVPHLVAPPPYPAWPGQPSAGSAVLYDPAGDCWLLLQNPRETIAARSLGEVLPVLARVEAKVAGGLYAAGFLAYEAAPALDAACTTAPPGDFPLAWFGIYQRPEMVRLPPGPDLLRPDWLPSLDAAAFGRTVQRIREHISRGETYQVNFTFPLECRYAGDPWAFFLQMVQGQKAGCAAFLDLGRYAVCSASPELFFALEGDHLTMRPMKGTARRGRTAAEDSKFASHLLHSAKDRAENLMILDMVRNDLARLTPGAVEVSRLFQVEKYPTVWQMTSTAHIRTRASLREILATLFPCASITGAPRYRTMQIIASLEERPRRLYTGALGLLQPGRQARFGVAIRTALFDRETGQGEYPVGAGITWDSDPEAEYRECLDKAGILNRPMPSAFSLLESLLWTSEAGYPRLSGHLRRLAASARYFDFPCDLRLVRARLNGLAASLPAGRHKVRLLVDADGRIDCRAEPLSPPSPTPLRLELARSPIDPQDPFLFHKTTCRPIYDAALAGRPGVEEVVLWNPRGEVTEATRANLVVRLDGGLVTPPVGSGLLAGVLRENLLREGRIRERTVTLEELRRSDGIFLINAVRGWRRGRLAT